MLYWKASGTNEVFIVKETWLINFTGPSMESLTLDLCALGRHEDFMVKIPEADSLLKLL